MASCEKRPCVMKSAMIMLLDEGRQHNLSPRPCGTLDLDQDCPLQISPLPATAVRGQPGSQSRLSIGRVCLAGERVRIASCTRRVTCNLWKMFSRCVLTV